MTKKSNKTRKIIEDTFIDLMLKTDFSAIFSKVSEALPQGTIFPASQEVLISILTNIYSYIHDNSKFMKVILGPNGDYSFQIKISNLIESILFKHLSTTNILKSTINYKYVTTIASSAQLSIVQKWLKTGMEETPLELSTFVSSVINSLYLGVLKDTGLCTK